MIAYIKGDLLQAPERLIIHGCNAQRTMGKGVAKQIRKQLPYAYEAYMVGSQTLGDVVFAECPEGNGPIVANAITQDGYRPSYSDDKVVYVSYYAVYQAFNKIRDYCLERGISEVAMPKIGTGLAGGDWDMILLAICEVVPTKDITFNVYSL